MPTASRVEPIEEGHRGLLVGEVALLSHGSSESGVEASDGVGGVDDAAQLGGEFEERHDVLPRRAPRSHLRRVGVLPVGGEGIEAGFAAGDGASLAHGLGDRPSSACGRRSGDCCLFISPRRGGCLGLAEGSPQPHPRRALEGALTPIHLDSQTGPPRDTAKSPRYVSKQG